MSDVIKLDNHRLLCGNAQVKEDVDKLLDGVKVDLLLTDPPYGIDIVKVIGEREREQWNTCRTQNQTFQAIQGKEQWASEQDQGSRERERERANGKVGKPRRCSTKTLQTSNR